MLADLDDDPCIDCPTPRFAVVVGARPLADLAAAADRTDHGTGYPMWMLPSELGLAPIATDGARTVLVVSGFFAERADAARHAEARSGAVRQINLDTAHASPTVVRVRRATRGFDADQVRSTFGRPRGPPVCSLVAGAAAIRTADDVLRIPDAPPWIRLPCAAGSAMFPVRDTDYGLVVREGIEIQDAGGVCGVRHFDRRALDAAGRAVEVERGVPTARCMGQPAGDRWDACPGESLESCTARAERLRAAGDDLRRAARLAAYACAWGSARACPLRWRIDLERGEPPGEVLASAVASCRHGTGERRELACREVERLLRAIPPERLRDARDPIRGSVGQAGCRRALPGWCEVLESSASCDREGCG
ncbi:MAG TPA: hypothetical protein RMH99_01785 [Sandaracinaceae bacterium LLY-WYZ-13_1]|nr:hypothetical protein [Sandaracinaceae bacterium LLY-WYZ-13_1]